MTDKVYCIYKHTSPSGKSYIGQTNNLKRRESVHKSTTACPAFAAAISKYGWASITHEIIADGLTLEQANELEEFYIVAHNTLSPNGYNLIAGGLNRKASEETKKKVGLSSLGRFPSEETKRKMRAAAIGKPTSEETKQKLRDFNLGKKLSEETKRKIGESSRGNTNTLGMRHTEEAKRKTGLANLGKKLSEETKKKIGAANSGEKSPNFGRPISDDVKRKLREALSGENNPMYGIVGEAHPSSKTFKIIFPDGHFEIVKGLKAFCDNQGLTWQSMSGVARGKLIRHKGFKCEHYNAEGSENTDEELQDAA